MTRILMLFVVFLIALSVLAGGDSRRTARPDAASNVEWSEPVKGVRGRLVLAKGKPSNGTPQVLVYLELQNASDVANPIHISPGHSLTFELKDSKGTAVCAAGLPVDVSVPDDPFGLVLPHDSILRFRVSVTGIGVPKDRGAQVSVPHGSSFRAWVIECGDASPHFLSGTFRATAERQSGRTWRISVELPRVQVPSNQDS